MTHHLRSEWQSPAQPVKGPSPVPWSSIDTVSIHYTAAGKIPSSIPGYLRAIQNDYLTDPKRGYSIGYNFAADQTGDTWELRGFDIKCAANLDHNGHTVAILVLVDGASPMNAAMLGAVRGLIVQIEARAGRRLAVIGHGQLQNPNHPTQCPGAGVVAQIAAGALNVRTVPKTPVGGDMNGGFIAANLDARGQATFAGAVRYWVTPMSKEHIPNEAAIERLKRYGWLPADFDLSDLDHPSLHWLTTAELNEFPTVGE